DCDTRIDEGQLKGDAQAGPAFTNANADGAGDVSYAVDPTSGKIAIAYSINRSAPVAGVSFLDNNLPSGGNANVLVHMTSPADLYASSVGITAMGGGKFAVAFFDTSGTRRMVAGPIDTSGAPAFVASDDMMAKGLHCAASDGDCSKLTKDGTRKPAIAAAGDDVIVAFVRAPEDVMCHAKSEVVTGAPLLANLLKVGTDGFEEQTPKAVKLGDSGSREAPALLALPDLKTGESLGFLLAYVDVDGAIALQSLHVNGGTIENGGILGSLSNAKERYSGVRLALGPKTDRGQSVGVAFQVGCTADARVGFALLNVKYDAQKGPLVDIDLREQLVGGSPNEKDANLAYSKNRDSWFVAYRAPASGQAGAHDLRARVLDAKGMPEGDDPYTLIKGVAMGSNATQVFLTPGIAPTLQADGWFGVVAYTEGSGNVLSTVAVGGCAKQ
ncbi:MAG TPA: hypothetical protein VHM19_20095, partial [Polyangiales bacterium]|nr:hypothetical protein [Polyangiales bacterium]